MSNFAELILADGTAVRFELTAPEESRPGASRPDPSRPEPPERSGGPVDDLPEGMGRSVPVARGRRGAAVVAAGALRTALEPLGPLIQEVHDAVLSADRPPQEVNVTFGIQVGGDLKLGVVTSAGQAHLTVSATWQPAGPTG
ncbi:CU044_2847 family protein [Streptomyces cyaneofuscatus]|uniref:CU044_2847 family protein n=1 Tax=Streptomyces cyaneofuscatus TaxID=66883 RepID=UPI00365B36CC